jgi:hypothetical protein
MKNIDLLREKLKPIHKFNERALNCTNKIIKRRIEYLKDLDYEVFKHNGVSAELERCGLLLIILVYQTNIDYIKKAIKSALFQKSNRCFITIIDHGTEGDVAEYLRATFLENHFVNLIAVRQNLSDPWNGDNLRASNLWNAAIFCSDCAYAYFLSCDDYLSENYAEAILQLFDNNVMCTSAAPLIVSVDESNRVNEDLSNIYFKRNKRPKYTNGIELARDYMNGGDLFISPGGALAQKIEVVYEVGGFDFLYDNSQIIKFAIQGVSGFDANATLFWRHHSGQTNKAWTKSGLIQYRDMIKYYDEHEIWKLNERAGGKEFAKLGKQYFINLARDSATNTLRYALLGFGLPSAFKALKNIKQQCPELLFKSTAIFLQNLPRALGNNYLPRSVKNLIKSIYFNS